MRQGLRSIAHADEVGVGEHARHLWRPVRQLQLQLDAHQARRVGDARRWSKEQRVDDSEHHCVGADANRQRQNGDESESGRGAQLAHAVTNVLTEMGEHNA